MIISRVRRARGAGRCDPLYVEDQRFYGGRSWPIDYRVGFFSSTTEATGTAAFDRVLDDAKRMRARMPHGRAETAVHGAVARMTTKGPQEMTVWARQGVMADLASRANTHFLLITSKDHCRLPCDAHSRGM